MGVTHQAGGQANSVIREYGDRTRLDADSGPLGRGHIQGDRFLQAVSDLEVEGGGCGSGSGTGSESESKNEVVTVPMIRMVCREGGERYRGSVIGQQWSQCQSPVSIHSKC